MHGLRTRRIMHPPYSENNVFATNPSCTILLNEMHRISPFKENENKNRHPP